jgi:hypothetical protein
LSASAASRSVLFSADAGAGAAADAFVGVFVGGDSAVIGNNWKTNHFRPSLAKVQMETVQAAIGPFGARNFKFTTGMGDCCQRVRKSTAVVPFSAGQTADNNGASPDSAPPNAVVAAELARITTPLASTSNAGHGALSKPNMISGFIPLRNLQTTSPAKNFKARSQMPTAKIFARQIPIRDQRAGVSDHHPYALSVLP